MEWLFEGLGTMILGLILGGTGGSLITYGAMKKHIQKQRGSGHSVLYQAGRDIVNTRDPEKASTKSR